MELFLKSKAGLDAKPTSFGPVQPETGENAWRGIAGHGFVRLDAGKGGNFGATCRHETRRPNFRARLRG